MSRHGSAPMPWLPFSEQLRDQSSRQLCHLRERIWHFQVLMLRLRQVKESKGLEIWWVGFIFIIHDMEREETKIISTPTKASLTSKSSW